VRIRAAVFADRRSAQPGYVRSWHSFKREGAANSLRAETFKNVKPARRCRIQNKDAAHGASGFVSGHGFISISRV
jgi:hypothetical protein